MMRNIILAILFFFALLPYLNGELQAASIFQQVGIASSPNPVGSGARALGMGGAFIGVADDATAASWNPAGLIQLEKPELSIVGEYFHRSDEFSSDQHPIHQYKTEGEWTVILTVENEKGKSVRSKVWDVVTN